METNLQLFVPSFSCLGKTYCFNLKFQQLLAAQPIAENIASAGDCTTWVDTEFWKKAKNDLQSYEIGGDQK